MEPQVPGMGRGGAHVEILEKIKIFLKKVKIVLTF